MCEDCENREETYGTPETLRDYVLWNSIPHYHEMSVHYAVRYLKTIERVLFVGGGDSMLLHKILLYPTLKKVVGLELDQKVTRTSFKYFGTQLHCDDDHVQ